MSLTAYAYKGLIWSRCSDEVFRPIPKHEARLECARLRSAANDNPGSVERFVQLHSALTAVRSLSLKEHA